jgi:hypothetical protein
MLTTHEGVVAAQSELNKLCVPFAAVSPNTWRRAVKVVIGQIDGSGKVTSIFGRWPSFHDSEVVSLVFD